jgi:phosphoglycerol transferase
LALFLVTTIGGFSSLIAYLVSPQIRVWERSTIVFGFLGLATVALLLDAGLDRWRSAARGFVRVGACALVVMVGALDQTSNAFIPAYSSTIPEWKDNTAFVEEIERSLPRGSMVYQVPYVSFPEAAPVNKMNSYDPLLGYILSDSLRWSDAAMQGTPADWGASIAARPLPEQVVRAASAGFAGVWVDRFGYIDGGRSEEASIARIARARPIVAPNARYVFYSLRSLRSRLIAGTSARSVASVGDLTINPTEMQWNTGFYGDETDFQNVWRWASRPNFTIRIVNPSAVTSQVTLRASAATLLPTSSNLSVSIGRGLTRRFVVLPSTGAELAIPVRVRPRGFVDLHFASDAAPSAGPQTARKQYVQLRNALIDPVGVQRSAKELLAAAR